ncbi:hypothetical protein ACFE04_009437 [Oxalis oulophora]
MGDRDVGNLQDSASADSFLDDFLKNTRTCTHTHTCNPPGPDFAHTHTCYHTHTQVIESQENDNSCRKDNSSVKPRTRPLGNREAVRKYRQKKKVQTAYLEEEARKLRLINQQLIRKLQGQLILEAEVLRLKSLLANLRGKIDTEIGIFPFQKQCNTANGLECQILPCFQDHTGLSSQDCVGGSQKIVDCRVRTHDEGHSMDTTENLE